VYYDKGNNVFNGIAYIESQDMFILTGKMWDHIYMVQINFRDYIEGKKEQL
jgi:glutamine cyclotransferase